MSRGEVTIDFSPRRTRACFGMAHNPKVAGSNPAPATRKSPANAGFFVTVQSPYRGCSDERGKRVAAGVGGEQVAQVNEQRSALQSAGDRGGQCALDEALAVLGSAAVGELAVDDRAAERALGGIVRGLDPLGRHERPQRRPDLQEVVGEAAVQTGALALARGLLEQHAELTLDRRHLAGEPGTVLVLIKGVPRVEQASCERKAPFSELLLQRKPL